MTSSEHLQFAMACNPIGLQAQVATQQQAPSLVPVPAPASMPVLAPAPPPALARANVIQVQQVRLQPSARHLGHHQFVGGLQSNDNGCTVWLALDTRHNNSVIVKWHALVRPHHCEDMHRSNMHCENNTTSGQGNWKVHGHCCVTVDCNSGLQRADKGTLHKSFAG